MATVYNASITVKCWKIHDCVGCGCIYRYLFKRTQTGSGSSPRQAQEKARKAAVKAIRTDVDVRPCPQCGQVQPRMIGKQKFEAHLGCSIIIAIPLIVLVILGATDVIGRDLTAYVVAGIVALAALVHLLVAREDPNANLETNKEKAKKAIDDDLLRVDRNGEPGAATPPPRVFGAAHLLLVGFAALAVPLALAAPGLRLANGWAVNPDTDPVVVGPGEEVKLTFPDEIRSVKGLWRGTARAEIENAAELGVAPGPLTVRAADDHWGASMFIKDKEKDNPAKLWARVTLPSDRQLSGKTVRVKVTMTVTYPKAIGVQLTDQTMEVTRTFPVEVATPGAGELYYQAWWGGMIGGSFIALFPGFTLSWLGASLKRTSPPAEVEPIEDRDDEDEDDRPRRRRRRDDDEDEEDDDRRRPRGRRDDDEDDEPPRRRRRDDDDEPPRRPPRD
jgi:hypothetical protein